MPERTLNVFQILGLGVLTAILAGWTTIVVGYGWGLALGVSWVTSIIAPLAITSGILLYERAKHMLRHGAGADDGLEVLIEAWDRDLAEDRLECSARDADVAGNRVSRVVGSSRTRLN